MWIRVKDRDTKHEYTIDDSAFDKKAHERLKDKDAESPDGRPLPPKHNLDLKSLPSKSTNDSGSSESPAPNGQTAESEKENP